MTVKELVARVATAAQLPLEKLTLVHRGKKVDSAAVEEEEEVGDGKMSINVEVGVSFAAYIYFSLSLSLDMSLFLPPCRPDPLGHPASRW